MLSSERYLQSTKFHLMLHISNHASSKGLIVSIYCKIHIVCVYTYLSTDLHSTAWTLTLTRSHSGYQQRPGTFSHRWLSSLAHGPKVKVLTGRYVLMLRTSILWISTFYFYMIQLLRSLLYGVNFL